MWVGMAVGKTMLQRIKKFSARAVVALKPEPSQSDTRDSAGSVSGLFLNIEQSGSRWWLYRYSVHGKPQ
jgi:hypothetical protein